jgi:hypothetical protein
MSARAIRCTVLVGLAAVCIAGCATQYAPEHIDDPYGFFSGLWHGTIFWFAVFGKILSWLAWLIDISILDSVTITGQPNTGFGYWSGFVLGMLGFLGGGIASG